MEVISAKLQTGSQKPGWLFLTKGVQCGKLVTKVLEGLKGQQQNGRRMCGVRACAGLEAGLRRAWQAGCMGLSCHPPPSSASTAAVNTGCCLPSPTFPSLQRLPWQYGPAAGPGSMRGECTDSQQASNLATGQRWRVEGTKSGMTPSF